VLGAIVTKCIECGKQIMRDSDYTFITRRQSSPGVVYFHNDCFRDVTGDKYLKILEETTQTFTPPMPMSGGVDFSDPSFSKSFNSGSLKYNRKHLEHPKTTEDQLTPFEEHWGAHEQKKNK